MGMLLGIFSREPSSEHGDAPQEAVEGAACESAGAAAVPSLPLPAGLPEEPPEVAPGSLAEQPQPGCQRPSPFEMLLSIFSAEAAAPYLGGSAVAGSAGGNVEECSCDDISDLMLEGCAGGGAAAALAGLRSAVERAEAAGVVGEHLDCIRARLEELDSEVRKGLFLTIRSAASGEVVARLRARPTDRLDSLRSAVLRELGEDKACVSLRFILGITVLDPTMTLADAGISTGDELRVVRAPLRCLTASFDGTARLWVLSGRDGHSEKPMVVGHAGPVLSATLSPDGATLLTVAAGGEGALWCTETGELLLRLAGEAVSGEFSADGQLIAGASASGTAAIWCATTGKCLQRLVGHQDDVKCAVFSPDGEVIATSSCDSSAGLWAASTGKRLATLEGHHDVVKSALFSHDGRWVVTASMDATARIWNAEEARCLHVLAGHQKALSSACFAPDGRCVLTASFDGSVRVWRADTGQCTMQLPAENNVVNAAAFSPDSRAVLVASASEVVRLYNAETGERLLALSGHEDWVRSAAFSPDGALICSGSYDAGVRIWDAVTGECLQALSGHSGAVVSTELVAR